MDYSALDLIAEPILIVDKEHRVLFANKKAREVYGNRAETCYGLSHSFSKPCYEYEGHPCPVRNIRELGIEKSGVLHVHKTQEGERYFYVLAHYLPEKGFYVEFHIDLFDLMENLKLSGQRTELFLSGGPVVFFQWKRAEGWPVEFVSPNVSEFLGYTAEDFISGRIRYSELIHPEDLERVAQEVMYHTEKKSPFWTHQDYRLRRKDGEYIWVLDYTVPLFNDKNEIIGYYGYLLNITEKHEQEELFHILAESNPHAVLVYDFWQNKILYLNQRAVKLFEYNREELLNIEDPISLVFWRDREVAYENLKKRKEGDRSPISYKLRIVTKRGKIKWVNLSSSVASFKGKTVSIITLVDISEEVKRERTLIKLATRDQLTGIFNRRALIHDFERLLFQAKRYQTPFSLVILDIDNFKKLNDTYGHLVGDRVLKEMVKEIRRILRKSDIFGRWGGEEFLVLLPMTSEPYAPAEKIRQAVESHKFFGNLKITISLGATTYREGDTMDSMISRADEALYQAKQQGKNRVVVI
ncbi:diguanylate cyclase [Hydrogenobacter sp. T-2]|uniref:diguanylate cyclase n=1 Tax=Pampinifervens diazotrophicum TaxID=1632018 RepID=UPI002B25F2B4|nr:diguanylate cyclase [Hydrogenobacter sp. T-2]WPM31577.1 diguanylate cyclase [Hydrogenobacter sp. T-2]